jgi:hypothetical protein
VSIWDRWDRLQRVELQATMIKPLAFRLDGRRPAKSGHSADRCGRSRDGWTKRPSLFELRAVLDPGQNQVRPTAAKLEVAMSCFGATMYVSHQIDCPVLG